MIFVSATRLRLRSPVVFMPFLWHTLAAQRQVRRAEGCLAVNLRRTAGGVYWTLSCWRDETAMRAFMSSGAHLAAMPKLKSWCDEAAVAHWLQDDGPVGWHDAENRLATEGRLSKVLHPSPAHRAGSALG